MLPNEIALMLADLGVPGFATGANHAGGNLAADLHLPSLGGFATLLSMAHLVDLTPIYRS